MSQGKPVIVTGYSGNMDFTTPGNSFLVEYSLVELDRDHGPYQKGSVWGDPNPQHAAELMRYVYENRSRASAVGKRAREDVLQHLHPRAVGALMQERLERILSSGTRVARRSEPAPPPDVADQAANEQMLGDFTFLHAGWNILEANPGSNRPVLGPVVVLAKKMIRWLLTPILALQTAYNGANTRVVTHLKQQVESLGRRQADLEREVLAARVRGGDSTAEDREAPFFPRKPLGERGEEAPERLQP
jgi:hypothetical protein